MLGTCRLTIRGANKKDAGEWSCRLFRQKDRTNCTVSLSGEPAAQTDRLFGDIVLFYYFVHILVGNKVENMTNEVNKSKTTRLLHLTRKSSELYATLGGAV